MTVMSHPGFVLLVWFFVGPLERSPSPAVFPPPVVACLEQARNQEPTSYRAIVQKILPTVVSIEAKGVSVAGPTSGSSSPGNDDFHPYFDHPLRQRKQPAEVSLGIGSGVIIDSQGVVLTSFHVVEGARGIGGADTRWPCVPNIGYSDGPIFRSCPCAVHSQSSSPGGRIRR
jgi:S1-C subfamily serine protease